MKTYQVKTSPSYVITLGRNLLKNDVLIEICKKYAQRWVIISDENVATLYARTLLARLQPHFKCDLITFPAGEANKTRTTKDTIEDRLLALGCHRETGILALGGGVVTDLAGFVAATFMRGLPCLMLPTTLLAMVDASIGGKTAVNTPQGKNLIGIIQQPQAVLIDLDVLTTLSQKHYVDGLIESFKHALILDQSFWQRLSENQQKLLARDPELLEHLIFQSIKIKADIVSEDAHEKGKRQLLNLGHTIGHAIEAATYYQISHGQAVGYGLLIEGLLSHRLGLLSQIALTSLNETLRPYLIPCDLAFTEIIPFLKHDKKNKDQKPYFVLLREISLPWINGNHYSQTVPETLLKDVLEEFTHTCN